MNWRTNPTEPGLYLFEGRISSGAVEIVELTPQENPRYREYLRLGSEVEREVEAEDLFLGPFDLDRLENWLLPGDV